MFWLVAALATVLYCSYFGVQYLAALMLQYRAIPALRMDRDGVLNLLKPGTRHCPTSTVKLMHINSPPTKLLQCWLYNIDTSSSK